MSTLTKAMFPSPENHLEDEAARLNPAVPDRLCRACPSCRALLFEQDLAANINVCPHCDAHMMLPARARIALLTDEGTFTEHDAGLSAVDALKFPGYAQKLEKARAASGENDGVICGEAQIGGTHVHLFVMEPAFMMASMGAVVGEKITRVFERASRKGEPVLGVCASGGARMQEGVISLMQMAKTSAAVRRHGEAGGLYIALLTDPTTGGVTASFAMLGDVIMAEPEARIAFAGPRVIEQTIHQKLPDGFQKAEFVQEKGFVDLIVARKDQKATLAQLLKLNRKNAWKEGKHADTE